MIGGSCAIKVSLGMARILASAQRAAMILGNDPLSILFTHILQDVLKPIILVSFSFFIGRSIGVWVRFQPQNPFDVARGETYFGPSHT
ncbi:hypothetical protein PIB30_109525 [Stylosanthes scabra]|uniref:Uncharacterized protein n=1 Tax=Stylosanthes scabra TaxID=79078 RepID=A0ABU6ZZ28_9FABA|nr:hypothetical protein [Stylosanthes scabra]